MTPIFCDFLFIFPLKNTQIRCLKSSIMEGNSVQLMGTSLESIDDKYSKELDVAVKAVQMACSLCQRVQQGFISKSNSIVQAKDDNSLVTIAGEFFHFPFSIL